MKDYLPAIIATTCLILVAKVLIEDAEPLYILKNKLQEAVKAEYYERAAVLRDRIEARSRKRYAYK